MYYSTIFTPDAADGNIRLYDVSATSRFSRVEIFFGGRWGTICNAAWVEETAQIACKELGHTPSLTEIPTYTTTFRYESYCNIYRIMIIITYTVVLPSHPDLYGYMVIPVLEGNQSYMIAINLHFQLDSQAVVAHIQLMLDFTVVSAVRYCVLPIVGHGISSCIT